MSEEHQSMKSRGRAVDTITILLASLGLAAACTKPNPTSCKDNFCSDPSLPFCDADGSISGEPGTCIAVACTAGQFETCRDDRAVVCNATGDDYDVVQCENGCSLEEAGCRACPVGMETCTPTTHIVPKYLPDVCDQAATEASLTVSSSTEIDTSVDAQCTGGIVAQSSGPAICLLRHGSITVTQTGILKTKGTRALALVADDAMTIAGTLDLSADTFIHGPAGGTVFSPFVQHPTGNGGAGFRSPGGAGGTTTVDGGAANGGSIAIDPAELEMLVGGARGAGLAAGGGAGGAATLISCRGTVSILGIVDANGGGGAGGHTDLAGTGVNAAAGGGTGGYVVLQGRAITITGELYANGGGGGGGFSTGGGTFGSVGADGQRSTATPADGGIGVNGAGAGGAGGIANIAPGVGKKSSTAGAGAGGGSVGFLQTYTPPGVQPLITPSAASPSFQANRNISLR